MQIIDSALEWAKLWQRRYFFSDYADLTLNAGWMRQTPKGFDEKVFEVVPPAQSIRSVLVFKPDEIGDAIQSLPALQALRRDLPGTRISLLCRRETAPIFERSGLVDAISPLSITVRWRRFPQLNLREALKKFGESEFDLALFLRTYPVYFRHFLTLPARYKVHPRDPRLKSSSPYRPLVSQWGVTRLPQALQLLQIVSGATGRHYGEADLIYPSFRWTPEDKEAVKIVFPKEVPDRFLVAHPFARFETRRYPPEYWNEVLTSLQAGFSGPVVVVGGPEDRGDFLPKGVLNAQGKLSLAQTGYLISRATAFLGNESGPAHWAAAMGRPTVCLFGGHSIPTEWAPLGNSLVLRTEVPCAPCHLRSCPKYGLVCLKELTPQRVLPEIWSFLERTSVKSRAGARDLTTSSLPDRESSRTHAENSP